MNWWQQALLLAGWVLAFYLVLAFFRGAIKNDKK